MLRWIKATDRVPHLTKWYIVRDFRNTGVYRVRCNSKDALQKWCDQEKWMKFEDIEWLDESINQEGSLKDWPEIKRLIIEFMGEDFYNQAIAPLLQNECKGDDLVAEASNSDLAALATHYVHPHNNIEQGLKPEHKCIPIARAQMSEGRDWWLGKITETVKEFPVETHCLHLKTPLKDVVFLCNAGDFQQLSVLCRHALGYPINESWMESQLEITALPNTSSQTLTQIEQDKKLNK